MEHLNRIEETYRRLISEGKEILRLFSGNPVENGFYFPEKILKEAYQKFFDAPSYQPHPKGLLEARQAISDYYRRQDAEVDPENLILTSGTSESFLYLFSLLGKPGDHFLIPCPSYPLFHHIAEMARVSLRHYPLLEKSNWKVDVEALEQATDKTTRGIVLISPNNPTGSVASVEEIQRIVSWANEKKIPLICDEVFSEFYFGAGKFPKFPRPMAVAKPDLCFTLNGISKMFALPALKLGWIAITGQKDLVESAVDRLETMADTFLSCHTPIQQALPVLFEERQSFIASYRTEVARRRKIAISLLKEIPQVGFVEPMGGFYLMMALDSRLSEEDLVIRLMEEEGIFVHPGYFYDYEKGTHLVISFLTEESSLREGLEKLSRFLSRKAS